MNEKNSFDILNDKIQERLDGPIVLSNDDTMSLYDFNEALKNGIGAYNHVFSDQLSELKKQLNKKIRWERLKKKNIPLIENIYPYVDIDGNYGINVNFAEVYNNKPRYVGQATINDRCQMNIEYLLRGFSVDDTFNFMDKKILYFVDYLKVLGNFANEYPDFPYEWNDKRDEYKQEVDDGFLRAYIDIQNLDGTFVTFSKTKDLDISRTRSRKYGELYDYIDFYRATLMKRFPVNINDFNPLFQTIARKGLENEKEKEMELKRVK